jgi:signal transduction histidine kinase
MRNVPAPSPRDLRLPVYIALGAVSGAAYVVFDVLAESRLRDGTLTGAFAQAHALVDHLSPLLVGMLLGVCAHYMRLRAQLSGAERAAGRVRAHLQKLERDQAVWVMAASVLHELNNPLHAIGLLADELGVSDDDPERRRDLVGRVRAQIDRARGHLQTLRAVRRGGEPDVQEVTLAQVIGDLAQEVAPLAAADGLIVEARYERPVQASADPAYVRAILENLVDNSLASMRGGGRGRVTIRLTSEGGRAVVRVCDDGPPIDARVHSALFEPLRSTKPDGLGLGLPIARALARAMQGDLSLEDPAGKTFRLDLPLRDAS